MNYFDQTYSILGSWPSHSRNWWKWPLMDIPTRDKMPSLLSQVTYPHRPLTHTHPHPSRIHSLLSYPELLSVVHRANLPSQQWTAGLPASQQPPLHEATLKVLEVVVGLIGEAMLKDEDRDVVTTAYEAYAAIVSYLGPAAAEPTCTYLSHTPPPPHSQTHIPTQHPQHNRCKQDIPGGVGSVAKEDIVRETGNRWIRGWSHEGAEGSRVSR